MFGLFYPIPCEVNLYLLLSLGIVFPRLCVLQQEMSLVVLCPNYTCPQINRLYTMCSRGVATSTISNLDYVC